MGGDFSKYPEPLRDVLPYLQGEACDLRTSWQVYKHLFMASEERTAAIGKRLGGLLGVFQNLLQDDMFVGIARLTDKDSKHQKNLTLWSLIERCQKWDTAVAVEVRDAVHARPADRNRVFRRTFS